MVGDSLGVVEARVYVGDASQVGRQAERDRGARAGLTSEERRRLEERERENRELRRANEIAPRHRRISPRRSSTAARDPIQSIVVPNIC